MARYHQVIRRNLPSPSQRATIPPQLYETVIIVGRVKSKLFTARRKRNKLMRYGVDNLRRNLRRQPRHRTIRIANHSLIEDMLVNFPLDFATSLHGSHDQKPIRCRFRFDFIANNVSHYRCLTRGDFRKSGAWPACLFHDIGQVCIGIGSVDYDTIAISTPRLLCCSKDAHWDSGSCRRLFVGFSGSTRMFR